MDYSSQSHLPGSARRVITRADGAVTVARAGVVLDPAQAPYGTVEPAGGGGERQPLLDATPIRSRSMNFAAMLGRGAQWLDNL
jgi:hypothetical protein